MKEIRQRFLRLGLSSLLIFNSSCIHTQSEETKAVAEVQESGLASLIKDGVDVEYLVYRESQLPLEDFFLNLKKGNYKKAFQKIDIRYKPANLDDEILEELYEAGFVPAYVKVKNKSAKTVELDEKSFSLRQEKGSVQAFYAEHLPKEFKKFSPTAVAANVYNTAVVVIGFAAVLGILVLAESADLSQAPPTAAPIGPGDGSELYNDVQKKVKVDYRNYLIQKKRLQPGEETKGLLFFYIGDSEISTDSQLQFEPLTSVLVTPAAR